MLRSECSLTCSFEEASDAIFTLPVSRILPVALDSGLYRVVGPGRSGACRTWESWAANRPQLCPKTTPLSHPLRSTGWKLRMTTPIWATSFRVAMLLPLLSLSLLLATSLVPQSLSHFLLIPIVTSECGLKPKGRVRDQNERERKRER